MYALNSGTLPINLANAFSQNRDAHRYNIYIILEINLILIYNQGEQILHLKRLNPKLAEEISYKYISKYS